MLLLRSEDCKGVECSELTSLWGLLLFYLVLLKVGGVGEWVCECFVCV